MEYRDVIDGLRQYSPEREWFEFEENQSQPVSLGEYVSALSNAAALCGKEYA